MSVYFPMPAFPDRMPVDISFVFADEKPAGKHGFLTVDGEAMRFEDGTLAKFWGVNFNGAACFPSHAEAEAMAQRLAQCGCNLVRFHQLDAEFATPNIFAFTKGKHLTTTRQLDADSMDRLDYLVYRLKEAGIYLFLDMLTYRKFRTGDGAQGAAELANAAKPWCMLDQTLIDLQKEYATQLWTHVNPYTGLAYKDDPAFILTEIVNECDFITSNGTIKYDGPKYYVEQFRRKFHLWLQEQGLEFDWQGCNLQLCKEKPLIDFKKHLTSLYYAQMTEHLRSIGVRIPINGTNWIGNYHFLDMQKDMDFLDTHPYVTDWAWGNDRTYYEKSITSQESPPNIASGVRCRVAGKPFFVSEWDMPWPNSYRAEAPIYYAALASLQGWSGLAVHTYAYRPTVDRHSILGRETTTGMGGSLPREGIFTVWNDWARFGLFPHAALMLRRSDVEQAAKKVAIQPVDMDQHRNTYLNSAMELHQCGMRLDGSLPEGYEQLVADTDVYPNENPRERVSCTGQLRRDFGKQLATVDSPRTKCVYGKLSSTGKGVELSGVTVASKENFGVIAMSSLSDSGICQSENILLTAIGKVRNTDQLTDCGKLADVGKGPILASLVQADITLETPYADRMVVWGFNAEGAQCAKIAVEHTERGIRFRIGDPMFPCCYYLIYTE